ncbi:MAG: carboxypeptidase-like regulatory domain-containing protein [Chitinophagaceae bacterium]|nr:carboxypeptidase-like regulatory domain-containing protein [Chitinophagaceae bacterium]
MKILHTLLLLILLQEAPAQSSSLIIRGSTVDHITGKPIPYTSIGIPNKSIGTVSDSAGTFSLRLPSEQMLNDSVVFSHVGYLHHVLRAGSMLSKNTTIRLQPDTQTLSEVVVKPKTTSTRVIGRRGKGLSTLHYNFYTASEKSVDDRLSKEAGMLFEWKDKCRIDELNFYISGNEFQSLKFRVLFYQVEEGGLPGAPLVKRDIIFEIRDGYRGWYKVDLKPYRVWIPASTGTLAVTLQWLESVKQHNNSKYFSITAGMSPFKTMVTRAKAMDSWTAQKQSLSFNLQCQCQ